MELIYPGISGIIGVLSGIYIALKIIAPKTKTEWDDKIVDIIEGTAQVLGIDTDELAKKSAGNLKEKIIKK